MPTATPRSNFAFLESYWPDLYQSAQEAEQYVWSAPRLAALSSRIALENAVRWLYDNDDSLTLPYQDNLAALLHEPSFRNLLGYQRWQGTNVIRKAGNEAAHNKVSPTTDEAFAALRLLHNTLVWLAASYSPERLALSAFDEALLSPAETADATLAEAQRLEAAYHAQQQELDRKNAELAASAQALAALHARLAEVQEIKAHNAAQSQPLPALAISEAETRVRYIDLLLREAGWNPSGPRVAEYPLIGMPLTTNPSGTGRADYVLWGDDGLPLAVVEAKHTLRDARQGRHQATLYADALQQMHGQRPVVFYTNGFDTFLLDDYPATSYPPRRVAGFLTHDELRRLITRRTGRRDLSTSTVNASIAGRYYQTEAIRRVARRFQHDKQRGALLVMATGAGKTRTAAALVELLSQANWVKNVLFLADRRALVRQAKNAFAQYLPTYSATDLTRDPDNTDVRLVFSTYPTMMNRLDEAATPGRPRVFGPGHFDLIIIDEAHRSVYQKYQAIFAYFDALLVGLTATPLTQIDRNTYELFGLEDHQPTYAYELSQAVQDKYLVPPRALSVPLKFQRHGIRYQELSEEEKTEYEAEFRDEATGELPDEIEASALNAWLFNQDTVDAVLRYVLANGIRVESGDKLGKTILFARSHKHAVYIEERFHKLFPQLGSEFARIIDNEEKYAQDLLDRFSEPDKLPQLAISVDMLDTGIDIPEVVNLVYFKPVRSSAKFWQMLGRGTRLRPNLFGPNQDKEYFLIFDFCENFEFFEARPEGLVTAPPTPLSQQVFAQRLALAEVLRAPVYHADAAHHQLRQQLLDVLHAQVAGLDRTSFAVRAQLRYVEEYGDHRTRWETLSRADVQDAEVHLSPLAPAEGTDELARRFDLLLLNLMLAQVQNSARRRGYVERLGSMGYQLSRKTNIPAVGAQHELLQQLQRTAFWQQVTLPQLEDARQRLRDLVKFLDREQQPIVYTHFADELGLAAEQDIQAIGGTALASYHQRVASYLRDNRHHITISRLCRNQPITVAELNALELLVFDGHERGTTADLIAELHLPQPPPLGEFVRGILGLDVNAAKEAFAGFVASRTLTADQITFVNSLIDYLVVNGTVAPRQLFESPFTERHHEGVAGVFRDKGQVSELFAVIDQISRNARAVA